MKEIGVQEGIFEEEEEDVLVRDPRTMRIFSFLLEKKRFLALIGLRAKEKNWFDAL